MSEQLEPRPYSDRELTLRAISLTFQRAQAAQLDLTDAVDVRPEADPNDNDPTSDDRSPDAGLDRPDAGETTKTGGLEESEEADLPNPIVTDANLRHYLDQANANQTDAEVERGRSRMGTLRAIGADRVSQARFNDAVLNAIHQLDHRTRLQQQTITKLEAELADARRALAALESDEARSR